MVGWRAAVSRAVYPCIRVRVRVRVHVRAPACAYCVVLRCVDNISYHVCLIVG